MTNVQEFYREGEDHKPEPLHYTVSGLDEIYLLNGFSVDVDSDGEQTTTNIDLDGLHRAIALHIVMRRKAPSGKELRFLREELGYTQAELASLLSVSDQSVARWEKEHTDPNGAAVTALRMLYLICKREHTALLEHFDDRLRGLAEQDDDAANEDSIVLSYSGKEWHDQGRAAA